MHNLKQSLGKTGEEIAKKFFLQEKYEILDSNWRFGHLEIDLIVQNATTIVFCEVKTRSSSTFGTPESFVSIQKQRNLIKAANQYVTIHNIRKEVRFDIISILHRNGEYKLEHIKDAFYPKW